MAPKGQSAAAVMRAEAVMMRTEAAARTATLVNDQATLDELAQAQVLPLRSNTTREM